MNTVRRRVKRGIAILSAAAMFLGLLPAVKDSAVTVQAATYTPSVEVYATKNDLMTQFTPGSSLGTTGTLVFGKDEKKNPETWYILGKDDGVSGDNVIIFATTSLLSDQYFKVPDGYDLAECDYGGKTVSSVSGNHYGASSVRNTMKEMAANESFFSLAEQFLMNTTKITSYDVKNKLPYTTEDKLYLLMGYSVSDGETMQKQIYAGSGDQIVLPFNKYWSKGTDFFLRGTWEDNITCASLYDGMEGVCSINKYVSAGIRPALNLNLSNVLFASAVPTLSTTASAYLSRSDAMRLRLDGAGKHIGTVTYNTTTGTITAVKDTAAAGQVSLVVQGRLGSDWYYSTPVDGTTTIDISTVDRLKEADLSVCKIWLETKEDNVIYAVNATRSLTPITEVAVTGIDAPESGKDLDTAAECATVGVNSTAPAVTWTPGDAPAGWGKSYTASVTLKTAGGYAFADSITATVNGVTATAQKDAEGNLTVTYTFAATAQAKLKNIATPASVTAANGTAKTAEALRLPSTVTIETEDTSVTTANVNWDLDSAAYDPANKEEQNFEVSGTVTLPEGIVNTDNVPLTVTIAVTVSAAGSTTPTQISNVSVFLSTPTAGFPIADFYATSQTSGVSITAQTWTPTPDDAIVKYGTSYTASLTLKADDGYAFADSTTVKVNGEQATSVTKNGDGTLVVTYKCAATEKAKLKKITTPASVTAANGTAKTAAALGLPSTVTIETEDKSVTTANVSWDMDSATYDPANEAEQKFTVNGTVTLPDVVVNTNGIDLNVAIEVTVSAKGATPVTPTPAPVPPTPAPATPAPATPATPAPATPAPTSYYIMDGANSNWVRNEDGSMAIRGNGEFSKFTGVKVDGVLIDPANYTVKEGSTIVTLKPEYLNTLSEGSHSFEIMWADGSAATDFTVAGNAADYIAVNAPQTGYDSHKALWMLLLLAALSGLTAVSITKKAKNHQ